MSRFKLYPGDCLDHLEFMMDESVDSIVTDPPYGLSFMGKKWDYDVPSVDVWRECLRVLKPGGHLLSFGGDRTYHRLAVNIEDAGFEIRHTIAWVYGSGFPKSKNLSGEWQGWGTALKPALEPICMARKPFKGTVEKNVKEHGVGAINIDACRVEHVTVGDGNLALNPHLRTHINGGNGGHIIATETERRVVTPHAAGRWPANLIHDGSEEVLECFPDAPGQMAAISGTAPSPKTSNVYGRMKREGEASANSDNKGAVDFKMKPGMRRIDTGSAARFFYCAKASKKDRGEGNSHPTVKPTELMRYLCKLVTPRGGVVLDPFMGSGSTGKAAMYEGFRFIGIEREKDYLRIAKVRIEAAQADYDDL